ncbi:MAG: hypothetical protein HY064_10735 [Bacteroidetes bacterium]|nr:hypothetical protein [Bacteroidota bacterium]
MDAIVKTYSAPTILALAASIKKDADAFHWLITNNFKELAALADVLVQGKTEALEWLKANEFSALLLFIRALDEDDEAVEHLMENNEKAWAATANYFNGNESAEDFLSAFFPHFLELGKVLESCYNNNNSNSAIGGFSGASTLPGYGKLF